MQRDKAPFAADHRRLWHMAEPSIWALTNGHPEENPALSIMRTLWDQPRWLEAYHLYDERGSELFEQICELPEYYLTRTEVQILTDRAAEIVELTGAGELVELGSG